jgi:hypothetical protein
MGFDGDIIGTWEEMNEFLGKYRYYCEDKNHKEEIFMMSWKKDESMEYYVEQLKYNLQWSRQSQMDEETL